MDNEIKTNLRLLELQNEAKSQEISIAYQTINNLEQRIFELTDLNSGSVDISTETQIDFIRRIAASRTKFSKEAQDIVDAIDATQPVVEEPVVDPNA